MSLYSFVGQTGQDQNQAANNSQYLQQGQNMINPGQAQVAASNPITAAGQANLGQILAQLKQQPQLPAQLPSQSAQLGLNGGAAMGQPGPTPQALALAQGLQPQSVQNTMQQFMNPNGGP